MKYIKKIIGIVNKLWMFLEKIPVFLEVGVNKFSKSKLYLLLNIIVIGSILFHYIAHPLQIEKEQEKLLVHYQDNNNGTITDRENGLQWLKCGLGRKLDEATCFIDELGEYTWKEAVDIAKSIDYLGYSDWRLPTIKELKSLVYCSNGQPSLKVNLKTVCSGTYLRPAIDDSLFPNTGIRGYSSSYSSYWSSSSFSPNENWCIDFEKSRRIVCYKKSSYYVRLVRDL